MELAGRESELGQSHVGIRPVAVHAGDLRVVVGARRVAYFAGRRPQGADAGQVWRLRAVVAQLHGHAHGVEELAGEHAVLPVRGARQLVLGRGERFGAGGVGQSYAELFGWDVGFGRGEHGYGFEHVAVGLHRCLGDLFEFGDVAVDVAVDRVDAADERAPRVLLEGFAAQAEEPYFWDRVEFGGRFHADHSAHGHVGQVHQGPVDAGAAKGAVHLLVVDDGHHGHAVEPVVLGFRFPPVSGFHAGVVAAGQPCVERGDVAPFVAVGDGQRGFDASAFVVP